MNWYIIQQGPDGSIHSYPAEHDSENFEEVWEDNMENQGQTTVLTQIQAVELMEHLDEAITNWRR